MNAFAAADRIELVFHSGLATVEHVSDTVAISIRPPSQGGKIAQLPRRAVYVAFFDPEEPK